MKIRAPQDRQRIAEALEERRQGEKNDNQRKEERDEQCTRFVHELPRRPGVVDAVALRQCGVGDLLERCERVAGRQPRPLDRRDRCGIELLEAVDSGMLEPDAVRM